MKSLQTTYPGLSFIEPDPIRDSPVTLSWFKPPYGKETLLLMGNADNEIKEPSLESELEILNEFVKLRIAGRQLTWMLRIDDKTIGVAWIEFVENHNVLPPSVHMMIGDKGYRGRGIGKATMLSLVEYIKQSHDTRLVYSRYLKSNHVVANMNQSLGFISDGEPYVDDNDLEWQNVQMEI